MPEPELPPAAPAVRKAECPQCGGIRNCDKRGEHLVRYEDGLFAAETYWYILECRGCENVFVQTVSTNSEDYDYFYEKDGSTGETYKETLRYWPALSKRRKPEWMLEHGIHAENLDPLNAAMIELYDALDNDLRMLSAIGIRTAYDIASGLLGIDENLSFGKKLDALVDARLIGVLDKERLSRIVDAGSASAHRGWRPTPKDLSTMMDVLEHFVHESFVAPARKAELDAEAAKLTKTVPPKPSRPKKPSTSSGTPDP